LLSQAPDHALVIHRQPAAITMAVCGSAATLIFEISKIYDADTDRYRRFTM